MKWTRSGRSAQSRAPLSRGLSGVGSEIVTEAEHRPGQVEGHDVVRECDAELARGRGDERVHRDVERRAAAEQAREEASHARDEAAGR